MEKVEQKTAGAILEKPKEVIIGGVTYQVAPPSTATLILVSELVSQLPKVEPHTFVNKQTGKIEVDVLSTVLEMAKDCKVIGEIVAILIIGAKELSKPFQFKNKVKKLSGQLLMDISPKALSDMTLDLLTGMETGDFFGLTTFLIEINLTKTTREVVT